jgi:hypothetical protein
MEQKFWYRRTHFFLSVFTKSEFVQFFFEKEKNTLSSARRECDYGDFLARDLEKSTYISVITDVFSP